MLFDIETRSQIAREHVESLRAPEAMAVGPSGRRTRRWLAGRLISAGLRLEPDYVPRSFNSHSFAKSS